METRLSSPPSFDQEALLSQRVVLSLPSLKEDNRDILVPVSQLFSLLRAQTRNAPFPPLITVLAHPACDFFPWCRHEAKVFLAVGLWRSVTSPFREKNDTPPPSPFVR